VDVVIPAEAALRVKVGERVKGGSSVLAAMPETVGAFVEPASKITTSSRVFPDQDGEDSL
jgi:hypothetical protein